MLLLVMLLILEMFWLGECKLLPNAMLTDTTYLVLLVTLSMAILVRRFMLDSQTVNLETILEVQFMLQLPPSQPVLSTVLLYLVQHI